ncbi:MAG: hypothetical protein JSV85_00915 [Candidatus Bathyarchaeota archaeon]|nr:MAG: hypothetical protein JSV85_00915 [Candidatus Bathyarchaeota archaeon]
MLKILKSRRGISPILATLLLIVIAVAAIIITYAWVITFTGSTTEQAGVFLRKDAVYWQSGNITVYVRNTGISDGEISAVYVGISAGNLEEQTATYDPPTQIVEKEGASTLKVYITYAWITKNTYHFRIAPKVGESLYFEETAP